MKNRILLRNALIFTLTLVLFAPLNLLVHEFGHCMTRNYLRGECGGVYVMPGVQIWPVSEFGEPFPGRWGGFVGRAIRAEDDVSTVVVDGWVALMGSGSVAVVSLLAMTILYIFRPGGWVRFLLLAQSVMFIDILTYTILPHWFMDVCVTPGRMHG